MDELLEQFLVEGRDLVTEAQSALFILRGEPANASAVNGAFRAVHTLKGSVAIFAMEPAERVLHAAEELLDRAHKHSAPLELSEVDRLVTTLDQIDRWIDELEVAGALGPDAFALASRLLGSPQLPDAKDELALAMASEGTAASLLEAPLTGFRYAPDEDAFFRGDDPLALVATIPNLVSVAITPTDGTWPPHDAIDPFRCHMVVEGFSAASRADVEAVFRLVSDQVTFYIVEAAGVAATSSIQSASVLRVDAARLEALADRAEELAVSVNALSQIADRADAFDRHVALAIRAAQADLERNLGAMRQSIAAVRLVSLAPTLRRLPRLVREVADELGRRVEFKIVGEDTEVDRQIAEALHEPLLHLVRNALDHGIEAPDVRIAAGKPPAGRLSLSIRREGGEVLVTLDDDGAGIDARRIRRAAVARRLLQQDAADLLTDAAAIDLIFAPGFSTASEVTGISGRGVGMDAVKTSILRLGGQIEIHTKPGQGSRFVMRLPANALTTRLLVVQAGPDRYAVPFAQVIETVRVESDRLIAIGTGLACILRGRTVPVLCLAELLGGTASSSLPAKLLVTEVNSEPVALRVDAFLERIDAMVRRPTGLLAGLPSIGGTALTGDGGVLVVLDLPDLLA